MTSLRFVAALLVFFWHCPPTRPIATTFSLAYAGVGFFFILSGFILTYSYNHLFAAVITGDSLRSFYAARFARIYPVHVVTLVTALSIQWAVGQQIDLEPYGASFALVQSWFSSPSIHYGGNGPAWSISVELLFYVLFPFITWALVRALTSTRLVMLVAAAIWLIMVTLLLPQHASMGQWEFYAFPPARLADFVVGMLTGLVFLRTTPSMKPLLRPTSIEILSVGMAVFLVICSVAVPLSLRFSALLMPAWSVLIFVFARGAGAFSCLLGAATFVQLGEVSYAFYLVHLAVIALYGHFIGWRDGTLSFSVTLSITLVLSFGLFHWIELPMRAWLRANLVPKSKNTVRAMVTAAIRER